MNPELFSGAYVNEMLAEILFGYKIRNHVLIGELAVDKSYRRMGIGSTLINEIVQRAKLLKARELIAGAV